MTGDLVCVICLPELVPAVALVEGTSMCADDAKRAKDLRRLRR